MKRGYVYLFAGLFILTTIIFIASTGVDKTKAYHNSINVSIGIDSISQTIDTITASNFVFPSHTYTSAVSINPGHNLNQIWVSVKDGEMNLSQALSSTNKLCPASPVKTNHTSSPTDKSQPYHYATEIQLPSGKNLQEAIDAGDFCYSWYTNTSSCSLVCGGGTRTTYCNHNGIQVADSYCYGTKPSVSCNTQSCTWQPFVGKGCGPPIQNNCNMTFIGTVCSPAGSIKVCYFGTGSSACYTRILVSTCG